MFSRSRSYAPSQAACYPCSVFSTAGWSQTSDVATPAPLIQQDDTLKISDHVYVILDDDVGFVPNVGIVVGESATLVIDTGLGLPNGEIVLGETRKVSTNDDLYVVSTHYHSEHELAPRFPDWPSEGIERIDGMARAAYAEIQ
jgi:hypothetical protein